MQHIYLIFISLVIAVELTAASPAEINQHRHRHRHGKNHRKVENNEASPTPRERTLPPNIWAFFPTNKRANDDDNVPKFSDDIDADHDALNEIADDSSDFEPTNDESIKKVAANCTKCKQNSVKMSELELNNLRIEYVKNQILHKLRLTERPAPVSKDELPEPIQEGYAIQNDDDTDYLNRHLDDYYAKTTQKIIFLTREPEKCKSHESKEYPSECFSFQIPSDVDVSTVESAQLWIYKEESDNLDYGMKQTFLLSEIGHWGSNLNFTKAKPIAIRELEQRDETWEKIDIAWPVKNWVEYHDLSHTIQVTCETCSSKKMPISMHNDRKPFIVIDTFPQRTISRQARSVNCGPGSSECCRDSLYIDFTTIGWDDWIIHPKGYNAYFCRGTCNRVASITKSGAHHSTIINKFMHHDSKSNQKKLELVPCCTATRYTSLQIFYLDSNKTATQVTLPNMIVESCGCS